MIRSCVKVIMEQLSPAPEEEAEEFTIFFSFFFIFSRESSELRLLEITNVEKSKVDYSLNYSLFLYIRLYQPGL